MQGLNVNPKGMGYLVLSSTFSESPESLPAYLLCVKLAKKGHHVYVSTTATGQELGAEIQKAKHLTEKYNGIIELVQPQHRWFEKPAAEWIQNLHKQYFGSLSELKNVKFVVGTLPGTVQTAVELKETLQSQAILLATCKLGARDQILQRDIIDLVRSVNEVWSVGPDIYSHYLSMFEGKTHVQHKQMDLLPDTNEQQHVEIRMNETVKLVSVWNHPIEFIHNGRKEHSKGSDIQGYYNLSAALGHYRNKLQWHIHGLQINDQKVLAMRQQARPNVLKVNASSSVPSVSSFPWLNCQVFIVPDVAEEMFNFFALKSIWLGIPTLVSCQSSIGKFLQSSRCSEASRAVVNLTGNHQNDTRAWMEKLNKEIFGQEANPTQWAKSMSSYFQMQWQFEEPLIPEMGVGHSQANRRSSNDSGESFSSAIDDPRSQSPSSERQNLVTSQLQEDPVVYDGNSSQVTL